MKKLITVSDVKKYAEQQKDTIFIDKATLITPAARDAAKEYKICFSVNGNLGEAHDAQNNKISKEQIEAVVKNINISNLFPKLNPELIEKIVAEVVTNLKESFRQSEIIKEADPCGFRLVRGDSINLETFNTGKPQDKINIKELLTLKECPNLNTGFMEIEESSIEFNNKGEEINYLIEGTLECTINGTRYLARAGDVLYVPANSQVRYSAPEKVKYFYVNYPAVTKYET